MNLNKLQRAKNSAACIATGSQRFDHALPIHAELHWLPIKYQMQYKIAVTVFRVLTTHQPSYLANIKQFCVCLCQLWCCGMNLLRDLAFADRTFSHTAPAVWNSLPLDIVSDLSCLATFKQLVKLYIRAYLHWFVTTPHLLFFTLWFVNLVIMHDKFGIMRCLHVKFLTKDLWLVKSIMCGERV